MNKNFHSKRMSIEGMLTCAQKCQGACKCNCDCASGPANGYPIQVGIANTNNTNETNKLVAIGSAVG